MITKWYLAVLQSARFNTASIQKAGMFSGAGA